MRVLHPVMMHEKFLASGVYRYHRGDLDLSGVEQWSIHELPDGSWFVRIDYDWRLEDGSSQLIEALIDSPAEGGRFQRVVAHLFEPGATVSKESYDFHESQVLIALTGADGQRVDSEQQLSPGYAVLLMKTTLAGIAAAHWPTGVVQPIPVFGGYRSTPGVPHVFDAVCKTVGTSEIDLNGRHIQVQQIEIVGEYPQTFWLDEHGIPLRRIIGDVTAELHNYAHRTGGSAA